MKLRKTADDGMVCADVSRVPWLYFNPQALEHGAADSARRAFREIVDACGPEGVEAKLLPAFVKVTVKVEVCR